MNQVTYFRHDNEEACNYQLVMITCCKKTNGVCVLVLKKQLIVTRICLFDVHALTQASDWHQDSLGAAQGE